METGRKVTAKLRERLFSVLRTCIRLGSSQGEFAVGDVASELGISERAVREYLEDLRALGYLEYAGGGLYRLKIPEAMRLLKELEEDPLASATVDLMVPADKVLKVAANRAVFEKVRSILRRIGGWPGDPDEVRRRLLRMRPEDLGLERVMVGDRLLLTADDYKHGFLHDDVVGAVSACAVRRDYVFRGILPLLVAFIAAVGEGCHYCFGAFDSTWYAWYPRLTCFKGCEPFERGEPFYELASEMPELLEAGRRIAIRLLTEIAKLHVCAELLASFERRGGRRRWLFVDGTLKIHGFVLGGMSRTLSELWREVETRFAKIVERANSENVRLVGVVEKPYGSTLAKSIADALGVPGYHASDLHLLSLVLQEGDATAPMRVPEERGKEEPKGMCWYELYWKPRDEYPVLKLEFLVRPDEDPLRVALEVLEVASALARVPSDPRCRSPELSILADAARKAEEHAAQIKELFELGLRAASEALSRYLSERFPPGVRPGA